MSNIQPKIILVRHLEDEQNVLTEDRNNDIVHSEIQRVPNIARQINDEIAKNVEEILVYTSSQIRSYKTAQLIVEELQNISSNTIRINIVTDNRSKGLYHGIYNKEKISDKSEKTVSKLAHKAFFKEVAEKHNMKYRFGDPIHNGLNYVYPELEDLMLKFGENQLEFTTRLYCFLADLYKMMKLLPKTQVVLVSHTPIIYRIFEIEHALRLHQEQKLNIIQGQLPKLEWQMIDKFYTDKSDLFVKTAEVKILDVSSSLNNLHLLEKEIYFLMNFR